MSLNHFEKMIQDVAKCNDVEAQRLFAHAEEYGDVDWSEISTAELKQEISVWMLEIQSGVFN